jgi:hypothetical protein
MTIKEHKNYFIAQQFFCALDVQIINFAHQTVVVQL